MRFSVLFLIVGVACLPAEAYPIKYDDIRRLFNEFKTTEQKRRSAIFSATAAVLPTLRTSSSGLAMDKYIGIIFDLDRTWQDVAQIMDEAKDNVINGDIVTARNLLDIKMKSLFAKILRIYPKMMMRWEAVPEDQMKHGGFNEMMDLFEATSEKALNIIKKLECVISVVDTNVSTGVPTEVTTVITSETDTAEPSEIPTVEPTEKPTELSTEISTEATEFISEIPAEVSTDAATDEATTQLFSDEILDYFIKKEVITDSFLSDS